MFSGDSNLKCDETMESDYEHEPEARDNVRVESLVQLRDCHAKLIQDQIDTL